MGSGRSRLDLRHRVELLGKVCASVKTSDLENDRPNERHRQDPVDQAGCSLVAYQCGKGCERRLHHAVDTAEADSEEHLGELGIIAFDQGFSGIEVFREIDQDTVGRKTPVDPNFAAESREKRKKDDEEERIEHAHQAFKETEFSRDNTAVDEIQRFKADEHQGAGDQTEKNACEIVSAQLPYSLRNSSKNGCTET